MKKGLLTTLVLSMICIQTSYAKTLQQLEDDDLSAATVVESPVTHNIEYGLQALDDSTLAESTGQALLYMGTTLGSTVKGGNYSNYNYYKMGFQSDIEANLNIKNLQLGCGGVNGAGGCDVDIQNLALTGVPTSIAADGTPQWNYTGIAGNERAASSAVIRNPFVEFAIKNPNSLSTREVAGVRLSADGIKGYMTAGTHNDTVNTNLNQGGINTFSGYITTAPVDVAATTASTKFGLGRDQIINAPVRILATLIGLGIDTYVNVFTHVNGMQTPPSASDTNEKISSWGIDIPSLAVNFVFPKTVVTGNRMEQLNLKVDNVPIQKVAIGAYDGAVLMAMDEPQNFLTTLDKAMFFMGKSGSRSWIVRDCAVSATPASCGLTADQKNWNNIARNNGQPVGASVCLNGSSVAAGDCTYLTNLSGNVSVKQDFTRMHNLPVATAITSGTLNGKSCSATSPCYDFNKGFYLGLQKEDLRWPGSNQAYVTNKTSGAFVKYVDDNYSVQSGEVFNPGDVSKRGWWMSFSEPLNFGKLEIDPNLQQVDMTPVLPQVSTFVTNFFLQQRTNPSGQPLYVNTSTSTSCGGLFTPACAQTNIGDIVNHNFRENAVGTAASSRPVPKNIVGINLGTGLGALLGAPLYVPLGEINVAGTPAVMAMEDLALTNYQAVVPNCWGNLKFC